MSTKVISKRVYQRMIPLFLVSVITGIYIVGYFTVPMPAKTPYEVALKGITDELTLWATVVAMFVLLYAFVGLIIGHANTIIRAKELKRRSNSMICIGAIILFLLLGYLLPGGTGSTNFQTLYLYLVSYAAVSSNIAWYMGGTYASYRYLRPTSLEAAVLVVMALFSMFRGTTLLTYIWPPFYDIGVWIEQVVATAVIRAFTTAMAVGTIVLVVRALVGKEPGLIELEMT